MYTGLLYPVGACVLTLLVGGALLPDLRHDVKSHVEQGDTIAIELEVTGTHTGPMHTPQGTVPATGKRVAWQSCDWVRVREGKIVSWHVYHDPTAFYAALGLAPGR
jgi:predicted ester cyclase